MPFVEASNLLLPGIGPYLAQVGFVPGTEPPWVAPVLGATSIVLGTAAFVVSWKQRSFLVAGLLAAGGAFYAIGALIATIYLFGPVVPGPVLGVISGLGILGLGIAKGIRTANTTAVIAR
jgi:hypothetical protein